MALLRVLVCLISTVSVSGEFPTYALSGGKVILNPDIIGTQQPDEILWKHNGNKVVEFDGRTQEAFGLFKGRVSLDWMSAELEIKDLSFDDSGKYDLEVFTNNKLSRQTLTMEVLDKLNKPNITCERSKGSGSTDGEQATLTCSAQSRKPHTITYEWMPHGAGPRLTISLSDKSQQYSCTVRNRLISATAEFTAEDCYPDEGVSVTLIVGLSLAAVLILAIVVGIFCKKKNKACFPKDVEKADDKRYGQSNVTASEGRHLLDGNVTSEDHERNDADINPRKRHVRNLIKTFDSIAHSKRTGLNNNPNNTKKTNLPPLAPGQSNVTASNEEGTHLLDRTPTVPSKQRLAGLCQSNSNVTPEDHEGSNADINPRKGLNNNPNKTKKTNLPPLAPGRKPSNSSSNSAADGDQLPEPDSDSDQIVKTEEPGFGGVKDPAPVQPAQNEENIPHSEPTAPSAQQPVNDKGDMTNQEEGQCPTTPRVTVKELVKNIEGENKKQNKTAPEQQAHEDGGVMSPPDQRPVPLPRQRQQLFPAVKAEDIPQHNKGADSNQVTEKTKEDNTKKPELDKKNEPDQNNSQVDIPVSDDTKSDNDQSLSLPSPEKPDQSKSGERQESSDATKPDLDQQNQDDIRQDSPEHEEQSDNTAKGEKGEDEGDADEKESEDEDSKEEDYVSA